MSIPRHCEERSNPVSYWATGLLRFARNDEHLRAFAPSREPNLLFDAREGAKTRGVFVLRLLRHNMPPVGGVGRFNSVSRGPYAIAR